MGYIWLIRAAIFLLAFLAGMPVYATHIVGGEFNMKWLSGNLYRVGLTIYFDDINGNPGAIDPDVNVFLYRKRDNQLVTDFNLRLRESNAFVSSSYQQCATTTLRTRLIKYYEDLQFDPNAFTDSEGYYFVYERCCRNGAISNIETPGQVGQAFYMEFPPLIFNSRRFINSTPELTPPLNDYACLGRQFNLPFGAIDSDGDSLYYELVEPFIGFSSNQPGMIIPPPSPRPYPTVVWRPGYNINNQIRGASPLTIDSRTGILNVVPGFPAGLMVFAMQVREFRNGQQISLTRREYQLQVRDCPPVPNPSLNIPNIGWARNNPNVTVSSNNGFTANIKLSALLNGAATANVCVRADALNFTPSAPLLNTTSPCFVIDRTTSEYSIRLQLPPCTRAVGTPYRIRLIASVQACPQDVRDTAYINVFVLPAPFQKPSIAIPAIGRNKVDTISILRGRTLSLQAIARDTNRAAISIALTQFNLPGSSGPVTTSRAGSDSVKLNTDWLAACAPKGKQIYYQYIATSTVCAESRMDTALVYVKVLEPSFNQPVAYTSLSPIAKKSDTVRVVAGDIVNFTGTGLDTARRFVKATYIASNFPNARLSGIVKQDSSLTGTISMGFTYRTDCKDVNNQSKIRLYVTNTSCDTSGQDSTEVVILTTIPAFDKPTVTTNLRSSRVVYDTIRLQPNRTIRFTSLGTSTNQLLTRLKAYGTGFSNSRYNNLIAADSGFGSANLNLVYTSSCEDINRPTGGTFKFLVVNDPCRIDQFDSVFVTVITIDSNTAPIVTAEVLEPEPAIVIGVDKQINRTVYVRNQARMVFIVNNQDGSRVSLRLRSSDYPLSILGITTTDFQGDFNLRVPITIVPSCELLGTEQKRTFRFKALTLDSICAPGFSDSVWVNLEIIDSSNRGFDPPNVLTPNGDGLNDNWSLDKLLPPDNCQDEFELFSVLNRYGVKLFETDNRKTVWTPTDYPAGTHFWVVRYKKRTYKGWVQVLK